MAVAVLLVLSACLKGATSQLVFTNGTDPPTSDANPTIIAEPENATDVSLFCHVVRDGQGTRRNTWRITYADGSEVLLTFNTTTGEGTLDPLDYFVTSQTLGGIVVPSNLTIRIFTKSLEMANISCGSGPDIAVNGTFQFRIISKQ